MPSLPCPQCNFLLKVPAERFDKPGTCPSCFARLVIPAPAAAAMELDALELVDEVPQPLGRRSQAVAGNRSFHKPEPPPTSPLEPRSLGLICACTAVGLNIIFGLFWSAGVFQGIGHQGRDASGVFLLTFSWGAVGLVACALGFLFKPPTQEPSESDSSSESASLGFASADVVDRNKPGLGTQLWRVATFGYLACSVLILIGTPFKPWLWMEEEHPVARKPLVVSPPVPLPTPPTPKPTTEPMRKPRSRDMLQPSSFHPNGIQQAEWRQLQETHGEESVAMVLVEDILGRDAEYGRDYLLSPRYLSDTYPRSSLFSSVKQLDERTVEFVLPIDDLEAFTETVDYGDIKRIDEARRTIHLKYDDRQMKKVLYQTSDLARDSRMLASRCRAPENQPMIDKMIREHGKDWILFVDIENVPPGPVGDGFLEELRRKRGFRSVTRMPDPKRAEALFTYSQSWPNVFEDFRFARILNSLESERRLAIEPKTASSRPGLTGPLPSGARPFMPGPFGPGQFGPRPTGTRPLPYPNAEQTISTAPLAPGQPSGPIHVPSLGPPTANVTGAFPKYDTFCKLYGKDKVIAVVVKNMPDDPAQQEFVRLTLRGDREGFEKLRRADGSELMLIAPSDDLRSEFRGLRFVSRKVTYFDQRQIELVLNLEQLKMAFERDRK